MEDRSLDDFLEGGGNERPDAEGEDESDGAATDPEAADGDTGPKLSRKSSDDAPIELARSTSRWKPDSVCDGCGETVSRLWGAEEVTVCSSCKKW